jgi:uncharacterized protein YeeX (DUF496 family)
MVLTLEELKEKVKEQINEVDLLEILEVTSEDLVNRFDDLIEEKYDILLEIVDVRDPFTTD